IGWIREGQLAPELNKALLKLKPHEFSDPVRSASGYHILGLQDKRTISLTGNAADQTFVQLQQVFHPFEGKTDKAALLRDANKMRSAINGCEDLKSKVAKNYPGWQWQDLGVVKLSVAPPWLAGKARDLPIGKLSDPMDVNKGALLLIVCNRKLPDGKVDREAVFDQIGTEKLELQA